MEQLLCPSIINKENTMILYPKRIIYLLFLGLLISNSYAASYNLTIKGNLKIESPECLLNTNSQKSVSFGDVLLTRLNGANYKQTIPFELTCHNILKNNLKLKVIGNPTRFNSYGGLSTSNSKIGIVFYIDSIQQPINTLLDFNYNHLPNIEVAPIKDMSANFSDTDGGQFSATAMLQIEYQ
ncbi:fimbrial protein [Providencia vermicola]|nr:MULTISPECIES: fimbrial protein [Providencia]MCK1144924.1 fimbrial protein [Providencia stuartii]MCR4178544.1 fimbrial protein [Providencia vermicola]URE79788.1 fimbrial protein [Providencia stuartii]WER23275.1 fimbrial protein [Providencia stuartii]WER27395.1 fimbrial protein [Providencia stuartii]